MAEDIAVWKEESTAELLIQINASPFGQSTKVLVQWNFSQNISGSNPNQKNHISINCKSCANHLGYGQELSRNYQSTLLYVPANELILQSTNALGCLKLCYYWKNTSTIYATCGSPCPNCWPVKKTAFTITSSQ